ncbi:MAG TPA: hypothetical protein VMZ28_28935 [Kofleriaceae bacterium]|nr:hypothetical protein [Kofleriaceae bacterium]
MRIDWLSRSLLALTLAAGGCAADEDTPEGEDTGGDKADQISGNDDPSGLLVNAERRLSALIAKGDVGKTFGVDDDEAPYPDTYWPMVDNGVAVEWLEKDGSKCDAANECSDAQPSPLAKFMSVADPGKAADAKAWEVKNHGKDVKDVKDWFGHCPGWAGAAQLFPPLLGEVGFRSDGSGGVAKCEPGAQGCVTFEIGDMNALQAEVYNNARSRFIGARCDTEPADIERDEFGRIVRDGKGCQGLNAGALVIVAGNVMKIQKKKFNIDAQNEFNTEQIWNQPAYRYTVNRFETLTEREAANLVATGEKSGNLTDYLWNSSANGFALVDLSIHWVTELGPNVTPVSGTRSTNKTRMLAVIELDRSPSDPEAEIIGGEYLDDESIGANRLRVHPFVWIALDVGPDTGTGHNPFVKGQLVKTMVNLALGDTGGEECAHDVCEEGGSLDPACASCAGTVCGEDAFCCTQSWDATCVEEAQSMCAAECN